MMTYAQAEAMFAKARDIERGKKLENNTYLIKRRIGISKQHCYAVRLHATDVVTIYPNGRYKLDTGGWRTVTTKDRINKFNPASVYSIKGMWYISTHPHGSSTGLPFKEGCVVHADGRITGAGSVSTVEKEKVLRKRVAQYAKGYVAALYKGEVKSGGDCFICCADGAFSGHDHIEQHIEEKYYVARLGYNALTKMGGSIAVKNDFAVLASPPGKHKMFSPEGEFIRKQIQKTIRRFVLQQLGLSY